VYEDQHGNCDVPTKYSQDPPLGHWVAEQRKLRRRGKLCPSRVEALDSIGFQWVVGLGNNYPTGKWEAKFELLKVYEDQHGNYDVPTRYSQDPSLGQWVAEQRKLRRRGELRLSRVEALDSIGFTWVGRRRKENRA